MSSNLNHAFVNRRGRTPRGNFELYSWLFMRISGVVLLGIAVFHLFWMHFVIGVDNIDFMVVAERWENPLWRTFDFFLLFFALTHGVNGFRAVLDDYIHRAGIAVAAKAALFVVYIVFLGVGTYIIFTFTADTLVTALP